MKEEKIESNILNSIHDEYKAEYKLTQKYR